MSHKITNEEIEALQDQLSQNRTELPEPEYEEIEGYQHLDVYRSERGHYKIESDTRSLETGNVHFHLSSLNSFLEDYLGQGNIHRAYQNNYSGPDTKAKTLEKIIRDAECDLTNDLERLAEELNQ